MSWNFPAELSRYGPQSPPVATGGLSESRDYCEYVAKSHYENFTVVSWLLPRSLRPHFHAVYAWCRWADDLADETSDSLALLEWWRHELDACYRGEPRHIVTVSLAATVKEFAIPQSLFQDLLSAFVQDQHVKEYETFTQLHDYCRRSANPVGRLVLHLFREIDEQRFALSDEVCTGLQLANFWQDVQRDSEMGRIYLPREDRERFSGTELIRFQVERTRGFFDRGRGLPSLLSRRARVDVSLFIAGGEAILDAIAAQNYDVLARRPEVSKRKKLGLMLSVLLPSFLGRGGGGFLGSRKNNPPPAPP